MQILSKTIPSNFTVKFKNKYKETSHVVNQLRSKYYSDLFNNCRGDLKKQWRLLNDITNRSTSSPKNISIISDTILIMDDVANEFVVTNYSLNIDSFFMAVVIQFFF